MGRVRGAWVLAGVLWCSTVQPGVGPAGSIQWLKAVPMVNGCPDLRGAGLDYDGKRLNNPYVKRELEALRCGLTLEGYPPGVVDLVVSGGDSKVRRDGRVVSLSNGRVIGHRTRGSLHNVQNGARAVDLWRTSRIPDARFYPIMEKYTAFRSIRGHGAQHRHLSLAAHYSCPPGRCE